MKTNDNDEELATKDTPPEGQEPVGLGNDHNGITEDSFFECLREIESAERKKDQEVNGLRLARKRAQEQGMSMKEFDFIRKLQGYSRPELMSMANAIVRYARFFKTPTFGQLEMFQQKQLTEAEEKDDARGRGMVAGRRGVDPSDNPWSMDNPLGQEWETGRQEGQKLNLMADDKAA